MNSLITTLIMVCEMVGVVVGPNVAMADMGWFLVPSSGFVYCLALALHSALLPLWQKKEKQQRTNYNHLGTKRQRILVDCYFRGKWHQNLCKSP